MTTLNNSAIWYQQRIATMLLNDLQRWTGKEAVLAGGSVRDWQLGFKAEDLDIYLESNPKIGHKRFIAEVEELLEKEGYTITMVKQVGSYETQDTSTDVYETRDYNIIGVYEFNVQIVKSGMCFDSQRVQIIRIDGDPGEVFTHFPVSTSQAMMDSSGNTLFTKHFIDSIQSKNVRWKASTTDAYLTKMMRKTSLSHFSFTRW